MLPEAFGSFDDQVLELMPGELSRSAQRQRPSLPYSLEMFWGTQLMRRRILKVRKSPTSGLVSLLIHGRTVDARFEVLGAPYSLLSVSLSASQKLYTRRGTLVGVSGKAENVIEIQRAIQFELIADSSPGTIHVIHPRTLSKSSSWHPIPLPTNLLHKSHNSPNIHQIATHFLHCITS